MRKVIGKILAAVAVLSFLTVGSAFATPMGYQAQEVNELFKDAFSFKFSAEDQKFLVDNFKVIIADNTLKTKQTALTNLLTKVNENAGQGVVTQVPVVDNGNGSTPPGNAPVPEPATMLLFGAGLVGLVGVVRRKANK